MKNKILLPVLVVSLLLIYVVSFSSKAICAGGNKTARSTIVTKKTSLSDTIVRPKNKRYKNPDQDNGDQFYDLYYKGNDQNLPINKARIPKAGLLMYAKSYWATDSTCIRNPYIVGAFFQVIWSEVEKEDGKYDWSEVDSWIEPWVKAGKKVAIRIMWSTSGYWPREFYKHPTPAWVWQKGAKYAYHAKSQTEIPLTWDPVYKKYSYRFLKEMKRKFEDDPNVLFLEVTPGAETNPFRFGTIRRDDPGFIAKYEKIPASDGKMYSEELWLETVKDYVDNVSKIFTKIPLVITLNYAGMDRSVDRSPEVGWYCTNHGIFVGQNGLGRNAYLIDGSRRRGFSSWDPHNKFFFEMAASTTGNEEHYDMGSLMDVMHSAERIHCSYLNVYPEDVRKGTKRSPDYDPVYEEALKYGAAVIGKQVQMPSGMDEILGQKVFTYEQKIDIKKLEALYHDAQKNRKRKGRFMDYFKAETDGSIQPVGMVVPENYNPRKKYPIFLQLHGIGPKNISGLRPHWEGMKYEHWVDPEIEAIYVQPYGRQNSFYQGMAEAELLQLLNQVQKDYSIDTDRVYVMGFSMGGSGTINLALHYPDKFAAMLSVDAAIKTLDTERRNERPWSAPQLDMQNPFEYSRNAYNLPVYMHTADTRLKPAQLQLHDQFVKDGCRQQMIKTHEGMPHSFANKIPYYTFISEMFGQKRNNNPETVKYRTNTLKYNKAYWMSILALEKYNQFAEIEAVKKEGEIKIAASNIQALSLTKVMNEALTSVIINDQKIAWPAGAGNIVLENQSGGWRINNTYQTTQKKSPAMPGLIKDAFESPFLVVYGSDEDLRLAQKETDILRNPAKGQVVMVSDIPYKKASELTEDDMRKYNIILFGNTKNDLLNKFQVKLPIQIKDGGVQKGNQFIKDASAVFIYPNPRHTSKYVVVWSGGLMQQMFKQLKPSPRDTDPLFLLQLPDYVIFNNQEVVDAGWYNTNWGLTE